MKAHKTNKTHYVVVGVLTVLIFTVGILIGNIISNTKIDYARELNTQLTLESRGLELKYELAGNKVCEVFDSNTLFEELYDLGAKLDYLETSKKNVDNSLLQLKEYYQILEIENWQLINSYQQACGNNIEYILYFYSNEGDCDDCEQQGHVLTVLRNSRENLYVFSFDINNDNPGIEMFRNLMNVTTTPTLIVKDQKLEGLQTMENIMQILEQ